MSGNERTGPLLITQRSLITPSTPGTLGDGNLRARDRLVSRAARPWQYEGRYVCGRLSSIVPDAPGKRSPMSDVALRPFVSHSSGRPPTAPNDGKRLMTFTHVIRCLALFAQVSHPAGFVPLQRVAGTARTHSRAVYQVKRRLQDRDKIALSPVLAP